MPLAVVNYVCFHLDMIFLTKKVIKVTLIKKSPLNISNVAKKLFHFWSVFTMKFVFRQSHGLGVTQVTN